MLRKSWNTKDRFTELGCPGVYFSRAKAEIAQIAKRKKKQNKPETTSMSLQHFIYDNKIANDFVTQTNFFGRI